MLRRLSLGSELILALVTPPVTLLACFPLATSSFHATFLGALLILPLLAATALILIFGRLPLWLFLGAVQALAALVAFRVFTRDFLSVPQGDGYVVREVATTPSLAMLAFLGGHALAISLVLAGLRIILKRRAQRALTPLAETTA